MTKVGFIKELNAGELIVLPSGGQGPLRLSMNELGRFARTSAPAQRPGDVLRALLASRKRRGKN